MRQHARIEVTVIKAPAASNAEHEYIARLVVTPEAAEPVTAFISFGSGGGAPVLSEDASESDRALVYRALVAGELRKSLRLAVKRLSNELTQFSFCGRIDLARKLKTAPVGAFIGV